MPDRPCTATLTLSPEDVALARNKLAGILVYLEFYGPRSLLADAALLADILNRGAGQLEDRPEGTSVFDLVLKPFVEDLGHAIRMKKGNERA